MKPIFKFVIQKHQRQKHTTHWDLMLEKKDILLTYRIEIPPEQIQTSLHHIVKIADHPIKFLTYQGKINNGLGSVEFADNGSYELISESENVLEMNFDGRILKGKFTMTRIEGDNWQFAASAKN
jgi:hypothetical protein